MEVKKEKASVNPIELALEVLVMFFDNLVKFVSLEKIVAHSDFIIAILIMVYFPLEINK